MQSHDSLSQLIPWQPRTSSTSQMMMDAHLSHNPFLYHLLPWSYAKMILDTRLLRFPRVDSWKDPFEKWWCDLLLRPSTGVQSLQAYGLCWTTSRFDEPYWRMAGFQRPSPIVRIRCRAFSLFDNCANSLNGQAGSLFLGSVQYRPSSRLVQLAEGIASQNHDIDPAQAASLLLHKRNSFRFEKEVRLLLLDCEPRTSAKLVEISSAKLVQQVMISPYTDSDIARFIKRYVRKIGIECKQSAILMPTLR